MKSKFCKCKKILHGFSYVEIGVLRCGQCGKPFIGGFQSDDVRERWKWRKKKGIKNWTNTSVWKPQALTKARRDKLKGER
ncbi:MAG: hypothetical protein KKB31_06390 [Nanoarchaeota archaeon]|nr:hypothetical protein [Nanoarchaeota archaeon]